MKVNFAKYGAANGQPCQPWSQKNKRKNTSKSNPYLCCVICFRAIAVGHRHRVLRRQRSSSRCWLRWHLCLLLFIPNEIVATRCALRRRCFLWWWSVLCDYGGGGCQWMIVYIYIATVRLIWITFARRTDASRFQNAVNWSPVTRVSC